MLRNGKHVLNTPEGVPAFISFLIYHLQNGGDSSNIDLQNLIEEWREKSPVIAIENTSVQHVEGVGILRMTHRAATENCKVWYSDLCKERDENIFIFGTGVTRQFIANF